MTTKTQRMILHAGLPKTATTSIQNALFSQRKKLGGDAGLLYPGKVPNHTNDLCTAFLTDPRAHISNRMAGLTDLDALLARAGRIREGFAAEIAEREQPMVLFSAEGMSNLNARELETFRDWALEQAETLSVFYVVRNPVAYTTSVIQQHLKGGEVLEEMYASPPLPNYRGRLQAAIAAFGRERIQVHVYEEMCAHHEGVLGAYLDIIGLAPGPVRAAVLAAQSRDNVSLSHEAALLLSSLNRQRPAFVDGEKGPRRALTELPVLSGVRGRKFSLPQEVRTKVADLARPDVAWLKEEFGITAYDDETGAGAADEGDPLPRKTIDSLAMILSNLINDRQVNVLVNRARGLNAQKKIPALQETVHEIRRISPDCKLPPAIQQTLDDAGEATE